MKKSIIRIASLFFIVTIAICVASCSKMKVGYLRTEGASFTPDSLNIYRNIDPESDRVVQNLPWVSTRIQGVAGTNPLNYELANVIATDGGDAQLFTNLVKQNIISVSGGMIVVSLNAVNQLPNGRYLLSIRVFNDDNSSVLNNVFKVIITDEEVFTE